MVMNICIIVLPSFVRSMIIDVDDDDDDDEDEDGGNADRVSLSLEPSIIL